MLLLVLIMKITTIYLPLLYYEYFNYFKINYVSAATSVSPELNLICTQEWQM